MNWYKCLWSRIGGRPWTYIMRDFYHEVEYVIIVGFFVLGYFARDWFSFGSFFTIVCSVTAGYILGHLFWSTRWQKGQKGDG